MSTKKPLGENFPMAFALWTVCLKTLDKTNAGSAGARMAGDRGADLIKGLQRKSWNLLTQIFLQEWGFFEEIGHAYKGAVLCGVLAEFPEMSGR